MDRLSRHCNWKPCSLESLEEGCLVIGLGYRDSGYWCGIQPNFASVKPATNLPATKSLLSDAFALALHCFRVLTAFVRWERLLTFLLYILTTSFVRNYVVDWLCTIAMHVEFWCHENVQYWHLYSGRFSFSSVRIVCSLQSNAVAGANFSLFLRVQFSSRPVTPFLFIFFALSVFLLTISPACGSAFTSAVVFWWICDWNWFYAFRPVSVESWQRPLCNGDWLGSLQKTYVKSKQIGTKNVTVWLKRAGTTLGKQTTGHR